MSSLNLHVTFTLLIVSHKEICLIWQRVTKWVFTPCVYTQNTQILRENSIMDENHIGPNINTILVQTSFRDGPYPSG